MRLKIATTACMVTGLVLLAMWPFIMGAKPDAKAPNRAMQEYAAKAMAYFGLLLIVFFVTILLAWFVLRQTRREFEAQTSENLENLIEATLNDHAKKQS
jgi:ribose/xylose/arabinose/galactoside ABC-type transport system permease subunit